MPVADARYPDAVPVGECYIPLSPGQLRSRSRRLLLEAIENHPACVLGGVAENEDGSVTTTFTITAKQWDLDVLELYYGERVEHPGPVVRIEVSNRNP